MDIGIERTFFLNKKVISVQIPLLWLRTLTELVCLERDKSM